VGFGAGRALLAREPPARHRVKFETASGSLLVVTSPTPGATAEVVRAVLEMELPSFDVELDARTVESVLLFQSAWRTDRGAGEASPEASAPPRPSPMLSPADRERSRSLTPELELGSLARGRPAPLRGLPEHREAFARDEEPSGEPARLLWGSGVGGGGGGADRAGGGSAGGQDPPRPRGLTRPRLLSLDITLRSSAGKLTIFDKAADAGRPATAGARRAGARAEGDDGVLFAAPVPEFDVASNATLLLAFGARDARWLSTSRAEVHGVHYKLPNSLVMTRFRMPVDSKNNPRPLLLSPRVLDFAGDVLAFYNMRAPATASAAASAASSPDSIRPVPPRLPSQGQGSPPSRNASRLSSIASGMEISQLPSPGLSGADGAKSPLRDTTLSRPPRPGRALPPPAPAPPRPRASAALSAPPCRPPDTPHAARAASPSPVPVRDTAAGGGGSRGSGLSILSNEVSHPPAARNPPPARHAARPAPTPAPSTKRASVHAHFQVVCVFTYGCVFTFRWCMCSASTPWS